ncbi:MAG: phosphatidate cytidylyltransferase [Alphaproteobacteria bacterium]|nr:phosphatidate cytidylyltransferase [Alphaproteobacteria bacterium]
MAEHRFDTLTQRCLSAAVLIPAALAAVWGGGVWLGGLALAAAALMAKEWIEMGLAAGGGEDPWPARPDNAAVAIMGAVFLAAMAATLGRPLAALAIAGGGTVLVAMLGRLRRGTGGAILALGVPYIVIPITALIWLRGEGATGMRTVVWVLALVWATDIGAYLAGKLIGGPKLAPAVSPGKTWSGLAGGAAAAAAVGLGAGLSALAPLSLRFVALGIAVSLVAQAGDLLESRIKRHFDVKDSGTIIPGHGGVLDRVDGLLTAFPFVAAMQLWSGSGDIIWT